jgi:NADPH:quinone reductase-like Zn-dependent oxidoreductase
LRFLVHGGGGSVGSFAAQLAHLQGAWCAVTGSRPSFPWLHEIEANQIADYREQRFEDVIHDIDVVIDPVGGEVQARSFGIMKRGGLLINLVGKVDRAAAEAAGVRATAMMMRYDAIELREIIGLVERGLLKPHVTQVLSLEEARTAMELNRQGLSHGKIVLKVA